MKYYDYIAIGLYGIWTSIFFLIPLTPTGKGYWYDLESWLATPMILIVSYIVYRYWQYRKSKKAKSLP